MKKTMLIALAAALLLCGCGVTPEPTETIPNPTLETTVPTEPLPDYYIENSTMERGTGGAVKLYEMDDNVTGLAMLNGNLLVCFNGSRLCLLEPETMDIIRQRDLGMNLKWDDESLIITETGIAFYDAATGMYATLDGELLTASTYVIEADMLTRPVITHSFEKICYATEQGLEVMNLSDGTTRRIREEHGRILSVEGLLFDDTVLCYTRQTADGEEACFVDIQNGSLYDTAQLQGSIHTAGKLVSGVLELEHGLGKTHWLVVGQKDGRIQKLDVRFLWDEALILPDGRVVLQSLNRVGVNLYCYDLETGIMLAQTTMPEQMEPLRWAAGDGERLWLSDGTGARLYCWDTTVDSRGGEACELVDFPALGTGDEAGMEQVERLAGILGDRFDVTITFADENNRTDGAFYDDLPDVRPEQYDLALEMLKQALEKLPDGLMAQIGKGADSGRVEILLVDDYDPVMGAAEGTGSIDVTDGGLVIRVSMCQELEQIFFHELFHVMEVRIKTLTDGFKDWNSCNPEGFEYLNSFDAVDAGSMHDSVYLKTGSNYFADAYGMVSAREDRAQVFLYALTKGEEYRFLSDTMQEKLTQISDMLRSCFGIDETVTPLWEQYLIPEEPEMTDTIF